VTEPAKATLQILSDARPASKRERSSRVRRTGDALAVQLNPTSLRLQRNNNVDRGGIATGTQRRQNPTAERTTLTFDLEFDTADSGRNVRDETQLVRQFVEPPPDKPADAPPRVEFQWGALIFRGIVTQVTEDLDYFSADGIPLRAKVSLSITEQDLKFERGDKGPPARTATNTPLFGDAKERAAPGGTPTPGPEPGQSGERDVRREVEAMDGESVQQLAARVGGNPSAWRSLMNGLDSPLDLPAGTPVQLGPAVERTPGLGVSSGFGAGLPLTSAPALQSALQPRPELVEAGFALTDAGGVLAAAARVGSDRVAEAVAGERAAFPTTATVPPTGRAPFTPRRAGSVVELDPRSLTYGASIPLVARPGPIISPGPETMRGRRAAHAGSDAQPLGRSRADTEQRRRDARLRTIRARPGGDRR
jgi:hypothetical protein